MKWQFTDFTQLDTADFNAQLIRKIKKNIFMECVR